MEGMVSLRAFRKPFSIYYVSSQSSDCKSYIKGMEHAPNIFVSFDKYLFLEVINIHI